MRRNRRRLIPLFLAGSLAALVLVATSTTGGQPGGLATAAQGASGPTGAQGASGATGAQGGGSATVSLSAAHRETAAAGSRGYWTFRSEPGLHPPSVSISVHHAGIARTHIFITPRRSFAFGGHILGQPGPEMIDNVGKPVWEHPLSGGLVATNFQAQILGGKPVLTWWQGHLSARGNGHGGEDEILNASYQKVATVRAVNGWHTDVHEFRLTRRNTAYLIAWKVVHRNLTRFGGPSHGRVLDSEVQEIDIATNKLVWEWDPLQHGLADESHTPANKPGTWNAFHLNSVDENDDGHLLISSRNTWAVYEVSHRTGAIIWRLGGKHSSFTLGPGASFAWQHDAQYQPNDRISLFDNEAAPQHASRSRGLVLKLDGDAKSAHVVAQYAHSNPPLLAGSQGSTQLLPDGRAFIGWGQMPYFSEYTPDGRLVFDAHFHGPDESYRAFRFLWTGLPSYPPSIAVTPAPGNSTRLYVSWNGATRVTRWQVLSGPTPDKVASPVGGPVDRTGFETAIDVRGAGPWFAVQGLNPSGQVLGTSAPKQRSA